MGVSSIFGITVDRLCRIRSGTVGDEDPFPLDEERFLDPSAAGILEANALTPGALVPPPVAFLGRALVLLGEPGVGKSTVLRGLVSGLGERVVLVDGADLSDELFEELVGRHLDGSPCTLVLDQVDESPMVTRLAVRLRLALRDRDTSGLRLLVACRTADYPPALTQVLEAACGKCVLADLAPLTREEAMRLASSARGSDGAGSLNGAALIEASVRVGAGALASMPLTLGLLVRTYREAGRLDGRPVDLFQRGVAQLLDEWDDERVVIHTRVGTEQRRAVAGRMAALLLLSGRHTVWTGTVLGAGRQDLDAGMLPGGYELAGGGRFEVTREVVAETLGTALFTGRGTSRLAFAHGSIAAYLAARYLVERNLPQPQLMSLFLVPGGDGTRSIPTMLRETAAWLVVLRPEHAQWLADADPESLAGHSVIVDSDEVRAVLVEALLRRAGEVMLGDLPWSRGPGGFAHPGLDRQLRAVLSAVRGPAPEDWHAEARVRLAVRLARESGGGPSLVEDLLDLADNDAWRPYVRQQAALAAAELSHDRAVPRLRALLDQLGEQDYASSVDPDDELRGALLDALWPDSLSTQQLLPHLRRRRNEDLFGIYLVFESTFARKIPEDDVAGALAWARSQADADGLDREVITELVDRALIGPGAWKRLDDVAALLYPQLAAYDRPAIPAPLRVIDEDGEEPAEVRDLRRGLAVALLRQAPPGPAAAWQITRNWSATQLRIRPYEAPEGSRLSDRSRLLGATDLRWVYDTVSAAATSGDEAITEACVMLADLVFDTTDLQAIEFVYEHQDHPAWQRMRLLWFDPVDLADENVKLMRASRQGRRSKPEPWPEAGAFARRVGDWAQRAPTDADAFWQLAWSLQFDPVTGQGKRHLEDDLLDFPGLAALGDDAVSMLTDAAGHFISNEHDRRDEWLGSDKYDRRGWAGYLALALLDRRGRLSDVPPDAWSSWVGALVWFSTVVIETGDRERKGRLLAVAAEHAPQQLADAISAYVEGELARGSMALEVEVIDPGLNPVILEAFVDLLHRVGTSITRIASESEEARNRIRAWETMLLAVQATDADLALDVVQEALDAAGSGACGRLLAVRAGRMLLSKDQESFWVRAFPLCETDPEFSRDLALACADRSYEDILERLPEQRLLDLYQWLSALYPPEEDPVRAGAHWVGSEEEAQRWRDRVLAQLSERGTPHSVRILADLSAKFPDRLLITSRLVRARTNVVANAWIPPHAEELVQLLDRSQRRLVRSEAELTDLLIEVLEQITADLPGHGELLWNRTPGREGTWFPKLEAALSAYLAHELTLRLTSRGLAVNREVLVRPTDAYGAGDRTDILVQATTRDHPLLEQAPAQLTVVIEVKGAWNRGLMTEQREQLALRYLPEAQTDHGVYLVGWYPPEHWTYNEEPERNRYRAASRVNLSELKEQLAHQAVEIYKDLDKHTRPFILSVPRPGPHDMDQSFGAGDTKR